MKNIISTINQQLESIIGNALATLEDGGKIKFPQGYLVEIETEIPKDKKTVIFLQIQL